MNAWLDRYAHVRARRIAARLTRHLPPHGRALDVGSGTGHNAEALRATTELTLTETDVVDLHVVGPGPVLLDGEHLPFDDEAFDASVLCFVLQYPDDPVALLREAGRVSSRVVVVQSTHRGPLGLAYLRVREFLTGWFAFHVARALRFVGPVACSLRPRRLYTRSTFREIVRSAGLAEMRCEPDGWLVSRDLYVLERAR